VHVLYCGPIASRGVPARGGRSAQNREIVDQLWCGGVLVAERPYPESSASVQVKALRYLRYFGELVLQALRSDQKFDFVMISGLLRHWIYLELIVVKILSFTGNTIIFDLKAGTVIKEYDTGSAIYRLALRRIIKNCSGVTIEGREYQSFVASISNTPTFYLPTFVSDPAISHPHLDSPLNTARLCYVGRVSPEKGVKTAIAAQQILEKEGLSVNITIVAASGQEDYRKHLQNTISSEGVTWKTNVAREDVRNVIRGCHFFVFPTRHPGEGHSKALTECMAEGIVPICSENGWNRQIINDSGRIICKKGDAKSYADEILGIIREGSWRDLSKRATAIVNEDYVAKPVIKRLIGFLNGLNKIN